LHIFFLPRYTWQKKSCISISLDEKGRAVTTAWSNTKSVLERHSTFVRKGRKRRGGGNSALEGGEGGGCTTKDGEKRSLFYSGRARPAIWSYKINHSSLPAVGATRQINRSLLLTNLLAILIISPTWIFSFSRSRYSISFWYLSSLLFVSYSEKINPLWILWRTKRSEQERIKRTKDWDTQCTAMYILYVAWFLSFDVCIEKTPVRASTFARITLA